MEERQQEEAQRSTEQQGEVEQAAETGKGFFEKVTESVGKLAEKTRQKYAAARESAINYFKNTPIEMQPEDAAEAEQINDEVEAARVEADEAAEAAFDEFYAETEAPLPEAVHESPSADAPRRESGAGPEIAPFTEAQSVESVGPEIGMVDLGDESSPSLEGIQGTAGETGEPVAFEAEPDFEINEEVTPEDRLHFARSRAAEAQAKLSRYQGGILGTAREIGGRLGIGEYKKLKAQEAQMTAEYKEAQEGLVAETALAKMEEQKRFAEAYAVNRAQEKGIEASAEKVARWYQGLSKYNLLAGVEKVSQFMKEEEAAIAAERGEEASEMPSDAGDEEFAEEQPASGGKMEKVKNGIEWLGKAGLKMVNVRTVGTAALLGGGVMLSGGSMVVTGLGMIAAQRIAASAMSTLGNYDAMHMAREWWSNRGQKKENLASLTQEELVDRMQSRLAWAMEKGKSLEGDSAYESLEQALQEKSANKVDEMLKDQVWQMDRKLDEVRVAKRVSNTAMKGAAVALGVFIGSGEAASYIKAHFGSSSEAAVPKSAQSSEEARAAFANTKNEGTVLTEAQARKMKADFLGIDEKELERNATAKAPVEKAGLEKSVVTLKPGAENSGSMGQGGNKEAVLGLKEKNTEVHGVRRADTASGLRDKLVLKTEGAGRSAEPMRASGSAESAQKIADADRTARMESALQRINQRVNGAPEQVIQVRADEVPQNAGANAVEAGSRGVQLPPETMATRGVVNRQVLDIDMGTRAGIKDVELSARGVERPGPGEMMDAENAAAEAKATAGDAAFEKAKAMVAAGEEVTRVEEGATQGLAKSLKEAGMRGGSEGIAAPRGAGEVAASDAAVRARMNAAAEAGAAAAGRAKVDSMIEAAAARPRAPELMAREMPEAPQAPRTVIDTAKAVPRPIEVARVTPQAEEIPVTKLPGRNINIPRAPEAGAASSDAREVQVAVEGTKPSAEVPPEAVAARGVIDREVIDIDTGNGAPAKDIEWSARGTQRAPGETMAAEMAAAEAKRAAEVAELAKDVPQGWTKEVWSDAVKRIAASRSDDWQAMAKDIARAGNAPVSGEGVALRGGSGEAQTIGELKRQLNGPEKTAAELVGERPQVPKFAGLEQKMDVRETDVAESAKENAREAQMRAAVERVAGRIQSAEAPVAEVANEVRAEEASPEQVQKAFDDLEKLVRQSGASSGEGPEPPKGPIEAPPMEKIAPSPEPAAEAPMEEDARPSRVIESEEDTGPVPSQAPKIERTTPVPETPAPEAPKADAPQIKEIPPAKDVKTVPEAPVASAAPRVEIPKTEVMDEDARPSRVIEQEPEKAPEAPGTKAPRANWSPVERLMRPVQYNGYVLMNPEAKIANGSLELSGTVGGFEPGLIAKSDYRSLLETYAKGANENYLNLNASFDATTRKMALEMFLLDEMIAEGKGASVEAKLLSASLENEVKMIGKIGNILKSETLSKIKALQAKVS